MPSASGTSARFRLVRRLAIGGMGEVFLARQTTAAGVERQVAVKRLLPELAEDPDLVNLFLDEARIVTHLSHANLVQIYDFVHEDGDYLLSMEYVPGKDLARICERAQREGLWLGRSAAVEIVLILARALAYAHAATDADKRPLGIVHRDVSPHNVLVSTSGELKLTDFGIARASNRRHRTETGIVRGKLGYMAPEQLDGAPVDARADVFALGVMLWELTLGRRLFRGAHEAETLRLVRDAPIPRPRELDPEYPIELEAVVLRALEREPARRTPSATQLAEELEVIWRADGARAHRDELAALVARLFRDEIDAAEPIAATDRSMLSQAQTTPMADTRELRPGLGHAGTEPDVPAATPVPSSFPPPRVAAAPSRRTGWIALGLAGAIGAVALGMRTARTAAPSPTSPTTASPPTPAPLPTPTLTRAPSPSPSAPSLDPSPDPTPSPRPQRSSQKRSTARHHEPAQAVVHPPAPPPSMPLGLGTLVVASNPWGQVTIDGRDQGQTDLQVKLPAGRHSIKVEVSQGGGIVAGVAVLESDRKTKCRVVKQALVCGDPS